METEFFLYTAELVEGYRVHVSLCAIIDLKTIPRLLRPPFVSPRPVAPLAVSSTLFPVVLALRRFIRIVAISEALFQKECPHA